MGITDQGWYQKHIDEYRIDPVTAHDWDSSPVGGTGIVPTLLLSTVGSETGQIRSVPLLYQPCGEGFIVVGSRGGSHRHPSWYRNLLARPDCSVVVGKVSYRTSARTLVGDEREKYWRALTSFWPDYLRYQERTSRQIPVVMLSIQAVTGLSKR